MDFLLGSFFLSQEQRSPAEETRKNTNTGCNIVQFFSSKARNVSGDSAYNARKDAFSWLQAAHAPPDRSECVCRSQDHSLILSAESDARPEVHWFGGWAVLGESTTGFPEKTKHLKLVLLLCIARTPKRSGCASNFKTARASQIDEVAKFLRLTRP